MLWYVFYNARVFSLRVSTLPQDVVVGVNLIEYKDRNLPLREQPHTRVAPSL